MHKYLCKFQFLPFLSLLICQASPYPPYAPSMFLNFSSQRSSARVVHPYFFLFLPHGLIVLSERNVHWVGLINLRKNEMRRCVKWLKLSKKCEGVKANLTTNS